MTKNMLKLLEKIDMSLGGFISIIASILVSWGVYTCKVEKLEIEVQRITETLLKQSITQDKIRAEMKGSKSELLFTLERTNEQLGEIKMECECLPNKRK